MCVTTSFNFGLFDLYFGHKIKQRIETFDHSFVPSWAFILRDLFERDEVNDFDSV